MQQVLGLHISNLMFNNDFDINHMDIELYAINCVGHNNFTEVMTQMLGQNVMLSSSKTRNYPSTDFLNTNTLPICIHLSVVFVPHNGTPDILKENLCNHLRSCGQMVFASAPRDNYLIRGNDKGIPTFVPIFTLMHVGSGTSRSSTLAPRCPIIFFQCKGIL